MCDPEHHRTAAGHRGGQGGRRRCFEKQILKERPHRELLLRLRVLNALRIHSVLALKHDITSTGAVLCLRPVSVDKRLNSLNVTQEQELILRTYR